MKKLLTLCIILLTTTLCAFAQKVDYTTYDIVAKTSDVTVVVKDNNWLMIVGSLKNPKLEFHLGYNNEQAAGRFDRLVEMCSNEKFTNEERPIYFCSVMLQMTTTGSGEREKFNFRLDNTRIKFTLSKTDIEKIKQSIEDYKQ